MNYKIALVIVFIQFTVNLLKAQSVIEIDRPTVSKLTNLTIWDCIIMNSDAVIHRIYVKGKIEEQNKGIVYEAVSQPLIINPRQNTRLNASSINIRQTTTNRLGNGGKFSQGTYSLYIEVYDSDNNILIATNQIMVSIDEMGNTYNGQMLAQSKINKFFSTNGGARIIYEYNPLISTFTQLKNNQYVRFEATPSVTIKGIPISSDILYSTEKNQYIGNMNQFNVHFDYFQFKENIQKMLLEKLEILKEHGKTGEIKYVKEEYVKRNYPEMQKWKNQLSSDKFKNIEQKAKQYDSEDKLIATLKESPEFEKYKKMAESYAIGKIDSLERLKDSIPSIDYEKMKWYLTAKETYDKINNKIDTIKQQWHKLYTEYNRINEKITRIENINYEEMLNDPLSMEKYLEHFVKNQKMLKIASTIRNFNIGISYPYYSEITLMGMRANGINIELNPKNYYLALTKGTIESTNQLGYPINNLNRSLQATRFGYGKAEGTHLYFNYLKMRDSAPFSGSLQVLPQDNLILGGELQLSLFRKRLFLKAEMAQSYHTYDRSLRDSTLLSNQNHFNQNFGFGFNSTSHKDRAFNIELISRLNDGNTVLTGYYKHIGSGYVSLALPYMLRGVERYEGHLSQYFWKRQLSLGAFIRNDADNVFLSRPVASYNNSIGVDLGLHFKKIPKIKISFAPTKQEGINIESGESVYKAQLYMASITVSHTYNIRSANFLTTLNSTKFIGNANTQSYNGDNLTIQQNIQFQKKIGLNVSYSMLNQSFDKEAHVLVEKGRYMSVMGTFQWKKALNSNLGYSHTTSANYPERDNFFIENSYRFLKNMGLRLRINYLIQNNTVSTSSYNYMNNGFGARLMLNMDW